MRAREMLGLMVMGLLLAMVPTTMQHPITHPNRDGLFIGLVLSTANDETLLLNSGLFVPETSVKKAGRTFNIGTFNGVPTVYVIALAPLAHVSATVQILIDSFRVTGIIDYGNAASVSPSLKLADVAVLGKTAFTGAWTWEDYEDRVRQSDELPSLKFGDYNVPEAGDNKLASLQYNKIKKYTAKGAKKDTFWYYVDPEWLNIAANLLDTPLDSCINGRLCTKDVPSIVYGVKGSSSDTYVQNVAYGKFLNKELDVSTVDRKSAATVSTAVANGVKHIVFRAASNKPGVEYDQKLSALASKNNLKVVSEFVKLISVQPLLKMFH
ncbi:bark storage protein A [Beta vulgaris subsp. vulgaris]|uniref:bark storage protein A n=1 Tax=Beta vulgaris subsp. vulgaris TaxID=3555 RepID=UPI002036E79A|nr:bark storage protein A [Beta vulgaris subsp. vulgaris]